MFFETAESPNPIQSPLTNSHQNLVFIDTTVENYNSLIAAALPGAKLIMLDPSLDEIEQISKELAQDSNISSLSIVSHGSPGGLQLGTKQLNADTLAPYYDELTGWGKALTKEADILLYGCDVAANDSGKNFVQELASLTGADVAASTNLTGSKTLVGDWKLEFATGLIEAGLAFDPSIEQTNPFLLGDTRPDLIVSSFATPSSGIGGNSLSFSFSLKNQGIDSVGFCTTKFYLSKDKALDSSDLALGLHDSVSEIYAGATKTRSVSFSLPSTIATGNYYLLAQADSGNTIIESNESNNLLASSASAINGTPDMILSNLTTPSSATVGSSLSFSYTIKNQGTGSAGSSATQFYLSKDATFDSSDLALGSDTVASLSAGANTTKTVSLSLPSTVAIGNYYLLALADGGKTVAESNENNNILASSAIAINGTPDMMLSNLTTPSSATVGGSLSFNYTLKNQGNGSAGSSATQFYLSKDTIFGRSDLALSSDAVASLSAGANTTKSVSLSLPSTVATGNYYLLALADGGKTVAESNENNNILASSAITINLPQKSVYPTEQQLTSVTMPSVPRPGYLTPFTDPTFGTTITRVSDQAAFGSTSTELRHIYAKNQPWNADGSYMLLNYGWPVALLDGHTYQFIRWVNPPGQGVWSNVNPSIMYGMHNNNMFYKLDIANSSDVKTDLRSFSEYDKIDFGAGEGNLSNNDQYVALFGIKGTQVDILVYDLLNNTVVSRKTRPSGTAIGSGSLSINNVSMSQSGDYVIVEYDQYGSGANQGIKLFDRSLNFVRQLSQNGGSHFDVGYDMSGSEVIVVQDDNSSAIVSVKFSTGLKTTILPASKMNWSNHISCRNINRPGWAYISESAGDVANKANYNETFAVKLDGSGIVERFAHEHHSSSTAYEREPMGVPNRDGTKILFASDWDNLSAPVYDYVAQMPPLLK